MQKAGFLMTWLMFISVADVNVAELYWLLDVVERDPDTFVRLDQFYP